MALGCTVAIWTNKEELCPEDLCANQEDPRANTGYIELQFPCVHCSVPFSDPAQDSSFSMPCSASAEVKGGQAAVEIIMRLLPFIS